MLSFFKNSNAQPPVPLDPLVTYYISQNLSGKLTVTSNTPNSYAYSITLLDGKGWRDTIEVALHRSFQSTYQHHAEVVGHCLIQTVYGRFLETRFDAYGQDITLERSGRSMTLANTDYDLSVPGLGKYQWTHDHDSITGAYKRLKLVEDGSGAVLARFGGAENSMNEFGVLEVYDQRFAWDQNWCGLCILTAVCIFAREERSRERRNRVNGVMGAVSNWGGLLTMGVPVGH